MSYTNSEHLRRALQKLPPGYVKPPPTSVPRVISLEEILMRAQNRFRAPRRETLAERLLRWVRG